MRLDHVEFVCDSPDSSQRMLSGSYAAVHSSRTDTLRVMNGDKSRPEKLISKTITFTSCSDQKIARHRSSRNAKRRSQTFVVQGSSLKCGNRLQSVSVELSNYKF